MASATSCVGCSRPRIQPTRLHLVTVSPVRVLVTGGAGFIGSHVAEVYLAAGHQVVIADNLRTGRAANIPRGIPFHDVDITQDQTDAVIALEKPDLVSHHAAQTSVAVSARDPELDAHINCCGLLNVLQSCVKRGVPRLIFSSSGGTIYGESKELPTPEDVIPQPRSPYAIHKLVGEQYLHYYRHEYGLSATILRYGNVYGPRQDPHGEAGAVAIFASMLLRGERPTLYAYDDQPDGMSRDYIYVEDVARANLCALEREANGTFNIASGRAVRTRELLNAIASACQTANSDALLLGRINLRDITPKVQRPRPGEVRESCLDVTRASTHLGWQPTTSLTDGIARTVASMLGSRP